MADESKPPDKFKRKAFKCHPKTKTNFVVCIICEEVFHLSDFNRLMNIKFLSDIFVICNDHQSITSNQINSELNDEIRQIIAEIKLNECKRAQEKLRHDVDVTLSSTRNFSHNNTTLQEDDPDTKSIITENILLRKLNEEITHKNSLLMDTIELLKNNKTSYAEITKNDTVKQASSPDIKVIMKSNEIDAECAFDQVTNVLQNDIIIPIKNVISTKKSGIIVKCLNNHDVSRTCDVLQNKLGSNFEVTIKREANPRLKIFGISKDLIKDEIENDLNKRNFYQFDSNCKILHTFDCANHTQGAILEVPSDLYQYVVNNNYKVYIGYQCCKVFDDFNVSLCYNCSGINHSGKKCKNAPKCIYCAGNHVAKNCNANELVKCVNCSFANDKYNTKYNTDHMACDLQSCEILKKKLNIAIQNINYPNKPDLPRYIGPIFPSTRNKNVNVQTTTSSVDKEETQRLSKSSIDTQIAKRQTIQRSSIKTRNQATNITSS